jgi:GntR family transcriptional regulator
LAGIVARNAGLPLYVRISERLIREIAAGHLADGARLPPERQMAADLGTSVGTLRKALADLETKGLLDRIQGSGNYVRARPEASSVYAFFRLERTQGGGLPTAEVLSVDLMPKPAAAPDFGASDRAHRIRRLRRLDDVVVALEEIWLDAGQVGRIRPEDLSESLYLYYRDRLGLVIGRVEDRIGVERVPDWTDLRFAPAAGDWAGFIERISWSEAGERVEYSRTWFDKDKSRYISRMGRGS